MGGQELYIILPYTSPYYLKRLKWKKTKQAQG